ncbi:receptor-type tyrosine-protein phosphatase T-like [Physella acuta]|uniref:receptor-type tyrosine-protein phosphatase T-like n=1 Tax=Physella acuta TaxID=109671 RepID=UPI0027DC30BC|nr:receptor-type tyrosine-protein phosphatase T-like [Physella acuta]
MVEKINMAVRKRREAGVNGYLSAQLQASAFNSTREFTVGDGKVWGGITNQVLQTNQYYMVYFVVVSTVGSSAKTNSSQLPQPVFTVPYERDAARNLTLVSFSTSSMCVNLTWLPPAEYKLILTKYMIQMSSTSNIQQQLPSVTLSPAVSEYSTCQLKSGTDYVMTLRGFGGSWVVSYFNLTFKTERQPVPPAPEPPTFLRSDYTTITVNIRPVTSPAVRITQYQIKVEKLTTATTRPEAGVPGYVATEYLTDAFTKQETFVVGDGKTYGQYLNKALDANMFYNIHMVSMFVTNDSTTYNWTTTSAFAAPYEANKPLTLSVTQISRTVTCLEVAWSSPDQMASVLTSFNIESVSISNKSEPKTSETLAPSDRSHQICQLRSASQYNVTISGFARPWVVALGSGIFSTGAHTNPPAPPPPVLITSTSTTIKVAIEPVTSSSSAPITSYVLMVKSMGTRQKRLAGVQGYETAELQPQDLTTRREFTIGDGAMWGSYRNKPLERYTEYQIYFVTVSAIPDSTTYSFSSMSEPVLTPLLDVSITSSTDVTLAFRNETCLNVTWLVPPEAASIITSFQIQFGKTGADASFITRNLTQNYRNVFFCGLLYYTNYTTVIKAFVGQIVLYTSSAVFSTLHDKPPVPAAPVLVSSTNTSITVTLKPVQSPSAPVTSYIVVIDKVTSTSSRQKRAIAFTVGNTTAELKSSELTKPLDFTIGDGGVYGGIVNRPLDPATFYNVYFVALSVFGGVTKYSFTKLSTPVKTVFYVAPKMMGEGGGSSGEVIGIVVGCLILVALVLAATAGYIFWRRKHKKVNKKESEQFQAPRSNDDISLYNNITLTPTDLIQESPKSGEGNISWNLTPLKEQSLKLPEQPAIKMPEQFWSKTYSFQENRRIIKEGRNGTAVPNQNVYKIPEATENEISISDEFLQLRTKPSQAVTSVAYLNKDLNRFPRLLPYDHSLVKLASDASSDSNYINASFMPGYKRTPVYIAAQSPYDPVTVLDFWRLIYQRSLKTIVMLTNLREGRIVKCSQYWPDMCEDTLGHLTIRVMSVQVYTDYTLRTLGVKQSGEEFHVVQQFQYTSWPEHGAPDDPIPLLDMLYKVRAHHSKDPTPILVHCGTGIGRSGVYIAIDTLIEQFQEEGSVNVFQCVHKMRKDRPFMVRTLKEYVFIYAALHENFFAGATTFGSEFKSVINNWRRKNPETGKTFLEEQFECLQMPPMKSCIKGLNQDISSQVSLDFSSSSSSSYSSSSWNVHNPFAETVAIDGLLEPGQYKLTNCSQFANPRDFVHFLLHNNIATIIAFRDSQTVPFIEKHRLRDFNMVVCQPPKENILNNFVVTDIVVNNVAVRLFEVNAEMASNEVKFTETMMANLIAEVFAWQDDKRREAVLVTGARFPEIFIPLALFCEKIKMDKSGDLFKIIRHCKYNNLQCQFNYDQYIYCYKTIWTFMRKFVG